MRYQVTITVDVSDEHGWDENGLYELYDEVGSHFGDFSADVKVTRAPADDPSKRPQASKNFPGSTHEHDSGDQV